MQLGLTVYRPTSNDAVSINTPSWLLAQATTPWQLEGAWNGGGGVGVGASAPPACERRPLAQLEESVSGTFSAFSMVVRVSDMTRTELLGGGYGLSLSAGLSPQGCSEMRSSLR